MPPRPAPDDFSPRPILGYAPYTTRLVLYRPRDMTRFGGNVVLETLHHAGGGQQPMFGMCNRFYASRGDVAAFVTHPITLTYIRFMRPDRYAGLAVDNYTQIWGMLADAARLLKQGSSAFPHRARRIYMTGYSFTGLLTTTFAARHHDVNRMPDGTPVIDGYLTGSGGGPVPRLDVPVIEAENQQSSYPARETAMRAAFNADAPDARRRRYEIVGFHHTPLPEHEPGSAFPPPRTDGRDRDCAAAMPPDGVRVLDPMARPLIECMFRNIADWVDAGLAPPRTPLIETSSGVARLDDAGNALGGLRGAEIRAPLGAYGIASGTRGCELTGWMVPMLQPALRARYGTRDAYLAAYRTAVAQLVHDRLIIDWRGREMVRAAADDAPAF